MNINNYNLLELKKIVFARYVQFSFSAVLLF